MIGLALWGVRIVLASEIRRLADAALRISARVSGCGCNADVADGCCRAGGGRCPCLCHRALATWKARRAEGS